MFLACWVRKMVHSIRPMLRYPKLGVEIKAYLKDEICAIVCEPTEYEIGTLRAP